MRSTHTFNRIQIFLYRWLQDQIRFDCSNLICSDLLLHWRYYSQTVNLHDISKIKDFDLSHMARKRQVSSSSTEFQAQNILWSPTVSKQLGDMITPWKKDGRAWLENMVTSLPRGQTDPKYYQCWVDWIRLLWIWSISSEGKNGK